MFYLLQDLLFIILVIFKLKCNNLILKEIMVHMCVYMHSHFIENHTIQILEDGRLISEVVLSHDPSTLPHTQCPTGAPEGEPAV
jgi:hypothetical protein